MELKRSFKDPISCYPGNVMPEKLMSANIENLDALLDFIEKGAKELGIENQTLYKILISTDEILTNIISYAYPEKTGDLKIGYYPKKKEGKFVIKIMDWGFPFNPLPKEADDLERGIDERKMGGLGIHMVRELVDEMTYKREGTSNVFTMVISIK